MHRAGVDQRPHFFQHRRQTVARLKTRATALKKDLEPRSEPRFVGDDGEMNMYSEIAHDRRAWSTSVSDGDASSIRLW